MHHAAPIRFPLALAALTLAAVAGMAVSGVDDKSPGGDAASGPFERPGLHNVFRLDDRLFSGGSPDGEEGFRSLRGLGVRTVVSVDGARPEVALAERFGLRYVHIPAGYDGIPRDTLLRLAKAVRDLPGPVYLHCHHGKHRGPAAAAAVRLCLDPRCSVAAAVADMERAGTDSHYTGLFAAVRGLARPAREEIDRAPADFPPAARVSALATLMVDLDARWDALKAVRAAGWRAPAAHPDLVPAAEALLVAEHYGEAARLAETKGRPEKFRRLLAEAESAATALHRTLRGPAVDGLAAEAAFRQSAQACTRCHAVHRDTPRTP